MNIINFGKERREVITYYSLLKASEFNRVKSWDFCYLFFKEYYKYLIKLAKSNDGSCFIRDCIWERAEAELGFYLASFGMYRGSSRILQFNKLFFNEILRKIFSVPGIELAFKNPEEAIKRDEIIKKLISGVREAIIEQFEKYPINGQLKKDSISATLITKILLGTTGMVPAFDSFFVIGVNEIVNSNPKYLTINKDLHKINLTTLSKEKPLQKSVELLYDFVRDNEKFFTELRKKLNIFEEKDQCPLMRVVDVFFWQYGISQKYGSKQSTDNEITTFDQNRDSGS